MANENNNKIPCGGFYLGDGLTMDGNTLKSLGGEQVQTDWHQNNTTAKDYIKNRPGGYEESFEITWDGDTTGRASATAEGMSYTWYKVSDEILTADDIIGATVTVVQNGVSQSLVLTSDAVAREDYGVITSDGLIILAAQQGTYVSTMEGFSISIPETGVYFVYMSSAGTTVYSTSLSNIIAHPFDDKYIPDSIARKNEVYTKDEAHTYEYDGTTAGRDTISYNALHFYKISDDIFTREELSGVSATFGSQTSSGIINLNVGTNCITYTTWFVIVTAAGDCVTDSGYSFTAPSAGIYARYESSNGAYCSNITIVTPGDQSGLLLFSKNKKWKIAVDDNGVISATEIPE